MARRHRTFIEGLSLHVHQRGNNRADMFHGDADRMVLLLMLADACKRYDVKVHVWILMDNHLHLIVTPSTPDGLARTMQQLGRRYVPYFNRRYARTGGLWEGRYSAHHIDSEMYWYRCTRYIELNRVRAGLVATPQEHPWSSYHAHAFGAADPLVVHHPLYVALGGTAAERQEAHRGLCGNPLSECELAVIRTALRTGQALIEPPAAVTVAAAA